MNPHNSLSHFEFTELNNMVLKNGGTVAAPRSKRNVRYVAPRDLPNSTFGNVQPIEYGDMSKEDLMSAHATLQEHHDAHHYNHHKAMGKLTTGEGFVLAGSAPIIIGTTAGMFALSGMLSAWSQEFFIGNKRSITYKQVAIRNGILGAVFGTLGVLSLGAAMAQS